MEAFANQVIIDSDVASFHIEKKKKNRQWAEKMPPAQAELSCSMREKLTQALPQATGKELRHDSQSWIHFQSLADLRHSIVHLKRRDQYTFGGPEQQTLYYRLLSWNPMSSVYAALGIVRHFHGSGATWIAGVEAQIKEA